MTLLNEIRALPVDVLATKNTQVIADALSVGRVKHRSTMIGVGTVLAKFGGQGGAFLDALASIGQVNRDIHWILESNIKRGEFDIGEQASRNGMQQLALQLPVFADGINALLALAEVPDPIDEMAVRKVCWSDDGVWQI